MDPSKKSFHNLVDELVFYAENDPILEGAITWLDEKAQKEGITFYDMVEKTLGKAIAREKAAEWMKKKNEN